MVLLVSHLNINHLNKCCIVKLHFMWSAVYTDKSPPTDKLKTNISDINPGYAEKMVQGWNQKMVLKKCSYHAHMPEILCEWIKLKYWPFNFSMFEIMQNIHLYL